MGLGGSGSIRPGRRARSIKEGPTRASPGGRGACLHKIPFIFYPQVPYLVCQQIIGGGFDEHQL